MSQTITVASWNILDGLPNKGMRQKAVSLGTDVIVLLEAYNPNKYDEADMQGLLSKIQDTYSFYAVPYGDTDGRADLHAIGVLVRRTLRASITWVDIGRNALVVRLDDTMIVGVHFDDRRESTRLCQFAKLMPVIAHERQVVLVGDFNATHAGSLLGRFLSSKLVSGLIDRLPIGEPGHDQSKLARIGSLANRLRGMTSSHLMSRLQDNGFEDADNSERHSTKLVSRNLRLPMAQLDHIMVRGLNVQAFYRPTNVQGSDHLPIIAAISEY